MPNYTISTNFVEQDMNGDKYLLKINDGDIKYPKLYILNNTSYDIYKYIFNTPNRTLEDILLHIKTKYPSERNKIKIEDIEACVKDFVCVGIFEVNY